MYENSHLGMKEMIVRFLHTMRPRYNLRRVARAAGRVMLGAVYDLRCWMDRLRLRCSVGEFGWKSKIHSGVMLVGCPANITLGVRVEIFHRAVLTVGPNGRIAFGDRSHLGVGGYLNPIVA